MGVKMKRYLFLQKLTFLSIGLFLLSAKIVLPQQIGVSEYQYLSPVPASCMNSPETNIIIRYGPEYKASDKYDNNLIQVIGNKSGLHLGQIILAENNRTLLFEPDFPFLAGETITVKLLRQIKTNENQPAPILSFNFRISEHDLNKIKRNSDKFIRGEYSGI